MLAGRIEGPRQAARSVNGYPKSLRPRGARATGETITSPTTVPAIPKKAKQAAMIAIARCFRFQRDHDGLSGSSHPMPWLRPSRSYPRHRMRRRRGRDLPGGGAGMVVGGGLLGEAGLDEGLGGAAGVLFEEGEAVMG